MIYMFYLLQFKSMFFNASQNQVSPKVDDSFVVYFLVFDSGIMTNRLVDHVKKPVLASST